MVSSLGLDAAAHPVVRAGVHGMLYYAGMAFSRGGDALDVMLKRSLDCGKTWENPVKVSRDTLARGATISIDRLQDTCAIPKVAPEATRSGPRT